MAHTARLPLRTEGNGMLTEKIKEQIFAVRESGVANMCDMAAV